LPFRRAETKRTPPKKRGKQKQKGTSYRFGDEAVPQEWYESIMIESRIDHE
jgi:hypothetical protein